MIEVLVAGLGMARPSASPLLLLKERDGERVLPIGIGPLEAHAIAMPLQGVRPPRPMTHDVFAEVIADLGGQLRRVEITDLTDNTFHARLMVDQAGTEHTIDIRPSDAVALAVRTETPIYVGGVPGEWRGRHLLRDQPGYTWDAAAGGVCTLPTAVRPAGSGRGRRLRRAGVHSVGRRAARTSHRSRAPRLGQARGPAA
jgi:uncharacterized protein